MIPERSPNDPPQRTPNDPRVLWNLLGSALTKEQYVLRVQEFACTCKKPTSGDGSEPRLGRKSAFVHLPVRGRRHHFLNWYAVTVFRKQFHKTNEKRDICFEQLFVFFFLEDFFKTIFVKFVQTFVEQPSCKNNYQNSFPKNGSNIFFENMFRFFCSTFMIKKYFDNFFDLFWKMYCKGFRKHLFSNKSKMFSSFFTNVCPFVFEKISEKKTKKVRDMCLSFWIYMLSRSCATANWKTTSAKAGLESTGHTTLK